MGRTRSVAVAIVATALVVGFGMAGDASAAPQTVPSSVETVPGSHSGDSIDDPAIWVHPTDPSRSLVIANDKLGSLDAYNLDGTLNQRITDPATTFYGNVDVRRGLTVGNATRDVVAVTHRGIQFFAVNPATRQLQPITEGTAVGASSEGLCLYRSALTGKAYVINISIQGRLRQYEMTDADRDGLIDVNLVRDFEIGSEAESCVADDATGALFVSEEDVALWKYDAEPSGGTTRTAVDRTVAAGGNLEPDIEGVTIATLAGGAGYVMASAQNVSHPDNSYFAVYQRSAPHALVKTFRVTNGTSSDDCDRTDGVAVTTENLGPSFPSGMFVCQDNNNDAPGASGNQGLKFVRLETVVDLTPGSNQAPMAAIRPTCDGTVCTFDAVDSVDPDGQVVGWSWNFGDGSPEVGGTPAVHDFGGPGTFAVTLTVTDDGGATDTATTNVVVSPTPDPAAPVSFVGSAASPNANTTAWSASVPPSVIASDVLLAWFASGSPTSSVTGPGAGWVQVDRAVDGDHQTTLWWKVATTGDAGSAVRVSSGLQKGVLTLAAYRGVDRVSPFVARAVSTQPSLTTQHVTPTVVGSVSGAWRVSNWSVKSGSVASLSVPAGEVSRSSTNGSGSGRITSLLSDSGAVVGLGAQGGRVSASNVATDKGTYWTLLLRPAVATPPPPNSSPVPRISSSCSGVRCTFSAATSSDPDGQVIGWSWNFGDDSGLATDKEPVHDFGEPGTYAVTLTVTDDDGATGTVTTNVVVATATAPSVSMVGSAASPNANTTAWSAPVPSAVVASDVLLAWFASGSPTSSVTGPGAGWVQADRAVDGDHQTTLWWKVATTGDAGSVVSVSSGLQKGVLTLAAYRGVDPVSPFVARAVSTEPSVTTQHVTPTVVGSESGAWRVSNWSVKSSSVVSLSVPAGEVERSSTNGSGSGRITSLLSDSGAAVDPGTQGGRVSVSDVAADKGTYWTILLRPR